MWPFADLSPFEAFGWEARGGYGDAYMTAQAFAASARAAGVRIRQGTTATGLSVDRGRVTGVRLADGSEISAGTVVVATGVWTRSFLEPYRLSYGVDVPIRVVREQIVTIAPGIDSTVVASLPIFSDLVSLQYVGGRRWAATSCSATATCPMSNRTGSRQLPEPRDGRFRRSHRRQGRHPVPRVHRRGDQQQLRRLLRRHTGLESGDLHDCARTVSSLRQASAGTGSRLRLRWAGWSPASSSTDTAMTRGFPTLGLPAVAVRCG